MFLKDRTEAGQILAEKLSHLASANPLVLALPRGGVPVAAEIARQLNADLDILLVKKIGAPGHPEVAVGAVSEDRQPLWKRNYVERIGLSKEDMAAMAQQKIEQIKADAAKWRGRHPQLEIDDRVVIVVDDGLATGATMKAALRILRRRHARKIIVALPVASKDGLELIASDCDEIAVLHAPEVFYAVGPWYEDFSPVEDAEVSRLLGEYKLQKTPQPRAIEVVDGDARLPGEYFAPVNTKAFILFAHGSGSTHKSPRNRAVAETLNRRGFATLRFDLLTPEEAADRRNVFDVDLLARRLIIATNWIRRHSRFQLQPIGYFGASTGAAAALKAAADNDVYAVVSRGGRPDLAGEDLYKVAAPALLIVGSRDPQVLALNEQAQAKLPRAELAVIPEAGHLFEEPGTLEEVVEYTVNWFEKHLSPASGISRAPREQVVEDILALSKPLKKNSDVNLLAKAIAGPRVIMLGEASHGTEEFYRLRRLISQKLIADHGYSFIAVEGDWPDCYKLNRYIKNGEGKNAHSVMGEFKRWPTWMWANRETEHLIEWMRGREAGFYGLDVYSLFESLDVLQTVAGSFDSGVAEKIHRLHECFEPYRGDEKSYARSLLHFEDGCRTEILTLLKDLAQVRLETVSLPEDELLDVWQNAVVAKNAESYYRAMIAGSEESWNIRDRHMMDTLDLLLRRHGEGARGIVWAHNTHIGDYHATDMLHAGYVNIGGLAREKYGEDNVCLVGFGTYEGQVLAGLAWSAPPQVMKLPPAPQGTYENYFHQAANISGHSQLFTLLRGRRHPSLGERRGHRAVGVVYQPAYEAGQRNYVPTMLDRRYDAFVFVDKTTALKPLATQPTDRHLLPETYPQGF